MRTHLKGLRATGRTLGRVRDLDVFMEKAHHYLDSLPEEQRDGLRPLLHSWQQTHEDAREAMVKYLDSHEYQAFKLRFDHFLNTPGAGALGACGHTQPGARSDSRADLHALCYCARL